MAQDEGQTKAELRQYRTLLVLLTINTLALVTIAALLAITLIRTADLIARDAATTATPTNAG